MASVFVFKLWKISESTFFFLTRRERDFLKWGWHLNWNYKISHLHMRCGKISRHSKLVQVMEIEIPSLFFGKWLVSAKCIDTRMGLMSSGMLREEFSKRLYFKNCTVHRSTNKIISSVQWLSCVWLFATHGLQHARPPCPSPTPRVYSDSNEIISSLNWVWNFPDWIEQETVQRKLVSWNFGLKRERLYQNIGEKAWGMNWP